MQPRKKILLLERPGAAEGLRAALAAEYEICAAERAEAGLAMLRAGGFSLVLLNPEICTVESLRAGAACAAPIVALSSGAPCDGAADAIEPGCDPDLARRRIANLIALQEASAFIERLRRDRITGLYAREYFYQRVRASLDAAPERNFCIICYNIENFKLVNDEQGLDAGDRLLRGAARILDARARAEGGFCGRLNADQFACLIDDCGELREEMFMELSERIRALPGAGGLEMKWGVYRVTDRREPVERMCDRALLAAASIRGRYGRYLAHYDASLRDAPLRERALAAHMESSLAEGRFSLRYQPKYNLRTGRLAGAEALVRWNHPTLGPLSPGAFIPLFEKNGFVLRLDQYVWEQACAALRRWDERGLPGVSVSVNVSRADVAAGDPEGTLTQLTEKYGLSPRRLHLEITESAYAENPRKLVAMLERLRARGFIVEMDDFGSGYSSLNMLNEMPIDVLKLDQRFVQSEAARPASQGILQFIASLARWRGLTLVAEGVETRAQFDLLREVGCDYAQGEYFSAALSAEAFEARLARCPEEVEAEGEGELRGGEEIFLLVADEDAQGRALAREAVGGTLRALEAETAAEAVEAIEKHRSRIALAVLSVTLPGADGFAALRRMRRERALCGIPVLTVGPADPDVELRALELGADGYCTRPQRLESLRLRMLRMLRAGRPRWEDAGPRREAFRDENTGLLNRCGLDAALRALGRADAPLAVCLFCLEGEAEVSAAGSCGYAQSAGEAEADGAKNPAAGSHRYARDESEAGAGEAEASAARNRRYAQNDGEAEASAAGNRRYVQNAGEAGAEAQFAGLLRASVRESDLLASLGGGTFAVAMTRVERLDGVREKARGLCARAEERCGLRCTFGAALWDMEDSFQSALERARCEMCGGGVDSRPARDSARWKGLS